jgi:hypothetical protein
LGGGAITATELHPAKASVPNWLTDAGIIKLVKELQLAKALSPI